MANIRRIWALALVLVMCASMFCTTASASGTVWSGTMEIPEGPDGYNYMLFGAPEQGIYYYETSNHTVLREALGGGAVHVLALIDTEDESIVDGKWQASGAYEYGNSNYEIVYCCDAATGSEAGDFYKRINLEDSEYFSDADAKQLRAILTHAYPFLTVEEAKAALKEAGFEQADELDRSELITAVQAAVWSIANKNSGNSFVYNKTATTAQKNTWGGYMHDFTGEITSFNDSATARKYYTNPNGIGDRINALREFYMDPAQLRPVEAKENQIVISKFAIIGKPVALNDNEFTVDVELDLNHGGTAKDDVTIYVTTGENTVEIPVVAGKSEYTITLNVKRGDSIHALLSGTQDLEKGVYFYVPEPKDVNGDGIATSREVGQNLIGVAGGETPVHSEADLTVEFEEVKFGSGTVSNISYMFLNKETGEVEFVKKIDVPENATSAPIVTMDGYVSVMFMKQATSGMFWFSEYVDEAAQAEAIGCLQANNPSYKGHDAVCFGGGAHELEFKKGKFVTYNFFGDEVIFGEETKEPAVEESVVDEPVVEESVVDEPVVEEPVVDEPVVEDPVVDEPVVDEPVVEEPVVDEPIVEEPEEQAAAKYMVNGTETEAVTVGGVDVIYVAASGKVPAFVWTSEEVSDELKAEIFAVLGVDGDIKFYTGTDIEIEYQHNKNKTKTVYYTVEAIR